MKARSPDFDQVGYKALDDSTLQVTLENSTPYFLSLLLHHSWFPVHLPTIRNMAIRTSAAANGRAPVDSSAMAPSCWRSGESTTSSS